MDESDKSGEYTNQYLHDSVKYIFVNFLYLVIFGIQIGRIRQAKSSNLWFGQFVLEADLIHCYLIQPICSICWFALIRRANTPDSPIATGHPVWETLKSFVHIQSVSYTGRLSYLRKWMAGMKGTTLVNKCDTRFSSIENFRDNTIRRNFNRDKNIENDRLSIDRVFDT